MSSEGIGRTIVEQSIGEEEMRRAVADGLAAPETAAFHKLWYASPTTWGMTRYRGQALMKNPCDLWIYHELIQRVRPNLIIETGTFSGGSALYFADQQALAGLRPRVISIDLRPRAAFTVDGIRWVTGDSIDRSVADAVVMEGIEACDDGETVMVVLDSDHAESHVRAELDLYSHAVSVGSYLVVEDTNICGRPVLVEWSKDDRGPGAAVDEWLTSAPGFERDIVCERYLLTVSPGGWLRRVS